LQNYGEFVARTLVHERHGPWFVRSVTATGEARPLHPADDELSTVTRLRAQEEELGRRLAEARRAAEARVFDAREAAARAETLAEADRRQEIARLRSQRERELGAVLDAVRNETAQQIAMAARRAAANREHVLSRLLAVVTGTATP
jgi:hypothetical protein